MASGIAANTVWQVGSSTGTPADTNGGGFVTGASGTDYSQQPSPQYALTGVASAGAGNTILSTSAAAAMVGNIAQCISGTNFNTGFYQILSVVVGTSITFSTNNAGASICTGVGASGVINIGGAFLSPGMAAGAAQVTNQKIWVYGGVTSTITTATPNVSNGTVVLAAGVVMEGYANTRGDRGSAPAFGTSGISSCTLFTMGNYSRLYNIDIFGANVTGLLGISTAGIVGATIDQCGIFNCLNGAIIGSNNGTFANQVSRCNIAGCTQNTNGSVIYGSLVMTDCYLYQNSTSSGTLVYGPAYAANCLFAANTGSAVTISPLVSQQFTISGCTFYNNSGISISGGGNSNLYFGLAINCIVVNAGTYAFGNIGLLVNCASYNSGTARSNGNVGNDVGAIVLTGSPFISTTNFALNTTAGAGAACRQAAWGMANNGPFGNSTANYQDVGAYQAQSSAKITWVPFTIDGFSG